MQFDLELKRLSEDMLETMYEKKGIGLAATQVGVDKRLVVIDIPVDEIQENPMVLVNPIIKSSSGSQTLEEGCLSVPEYRAEVNRFETILVNFQTITGESKIITAEGLLSVCIQHEIDHLNGTLFIDYLAPLKRRIIRKKLRKLVISNG